MMDLITRLENSDFTEDEPDGPDEFDLMLSIIKQIEQEIHQRCQERIEPSDEAVA